MSGCPFLREITALLPESNNTVPIASASQPGWGFEWIVHAQEALVPSGVYRCPCCLAPLVREGAGFVHQMRQTQHIWHAGRSVEINKPRLPNTTRESEIHRIGKIIAAQQLRCAIAGRAPYPSFSARCSRCSDDYDETVPNMPPDARVEIEHNINGVGIVDVAVVSPETGKALFIVEIYRKHACAWTRLLRMHACCRFVEIDAVGLLEWPRQWILVSGLLSSMHARELPPFCAGDRALVVAERNAVCTEARAAHLPVPWNVSPSIVRSIFVPCASCGRTGALVFSLRVGTKPTYGFPISPMDVEQVFPDDVATALSFDARSIPITHRGGTADGRPTYCSTCQQRRDVADMCIMSKNLSDMSVAELLTAAHARLIFSKESFFPTLQYDSLAPVGTTCAERARRWLVDERICLHCGTAVPEKEFREDNRDGSRFHYYCKYANSCI